MTREENVLFRGPSQPTRAGVWRWWPGRSYRYNRDIFLVGVVILVLARPHRTAGPLGSRRLALDDRDGQKTAVTPPYFPKANSTAFSSSGFMIS